MNTRRACFLLIHPWLGLRGLGSLVEYFPQPSTAIPTAPGHAISMRRWREETLRIVRAQDTRWDAVVGTDDSAAILGDVLREGLAERAMILDPPLGPAILPTPDELEQIARAFPSAPTDLPDLDDGWDAPVTINLLAFNDGSDPVRREYARRLAEAVAERQPLDAAASRPEPEAAEILSVDPLLDEFGDRVLVAWSRPYHVCAEALQRHGYQQSRLLEAPALEWISAPQACARRLAALR